MSRWLGRIGVRIGLAAALVLAIGAIVTLARLADSNSASGEQYANPPDIVTSIDPTAGDDAEVLPTPSFADNDAVSHTATNFATRWLRRDLPAGDWQANLSPLSTDALAKSLAGVDPQSVPAMRIVEDAELVLRTEQYAQIKIGMDSGSLILGLLRVERQWLVDAIDWYPA